VQAVLNIVNNFATEGSSAFSVMSAAVGSSNTIEVLTRRFQQVRGMEGNRGERREERGKYWERERERDKKRRGEERG
jgi:hypothetical protein